MGSIEFLRRFSMAAMLTAIVTGLISLVQLFTAPVTGPTLLGISAGAFLLGMVLDRRVRKMMDDSNAGR